MHLKTKKGPSEEEGFSWTRIAVMEIMQPMASDIGVSLHQAPLRMFFHPLLAAPSLTDTEIPKTSKHPCDDLLTYLPYNDKACAHLTAFPVTAQATKHCSTNHSFNAQTPSSSKRDTFGKKGKYMHSLLY